tara:strand:+ start:49 stop:495 length:447 start_codon:yes stop_codon:yes gene_type:complete
MTGYPNKYTIEIICRFVGETKEVIFPELLKNEDFLELDKKTTFYKRIDPDRILGGEGLEALPAPEDDESDIERQEAIDRVESVLDTLTYREREIIKMRFGIIEGTTCTLEEAGKKLNITRTRVNQLEKRALRKLRHPARSRKLEGFLA